MVMGFPKCWNKESVTAPSRETYLDYVAREPDMQVCIVRSMEMVCLEENFTLIRKLFYCHIMQKIRKVVCLFFASEPF